MNAPATGLISQPTRAPTLRFALRDLRGGLAGLRIFLLCIALGVAAIVGVESLAQALNDGMGREGRVILGGDASFALIHRRLSADERRLFVTLANWVLGRLSPLTSTTPVPTFSTVAVPPALTVEPVGASMMI